MTPQPEATIRWDKAAITALLQKSPTARLRALQYLMAQQTHAEQVASVVLEHNSVGFNELDAPVLTPLARLALHPKGLTSGMDSVLRFRLPKYWRQLLEPIAQKAGARALKVTKSYVEIYNA